MSADDRSATGAPLHISHVSLAVRDLALVGGFYESLGLERLSAAGESLELGAGGVPLLKLEARPAAEPDSPREPGLFHTAFLMPTRADLGRWLNGAIDRGIRFTGASDHKVSEALYLDDPEGNGIEVYADRPRSEWQRENNEYMMTTDRLNIDDLSRAGTQLGSPTTEAPAGLRIGHIHLRVNDIAQFEGFYTGVLGLEITHRRPGGLWLGSGGYHHHVAANTWQSARSGRRRPGTNGLVDFTIAIRDAGTAHSLEDRLRRSDSAKTSGDAILVADPAGIAITLKQAGAGH